MGFRLWNRLIFDIWMSLWDLHNVLNVVHKDFHLGNILLLLQDDKIIPLIHDFGNSKIKKDDWTVTDRQNDPSGFILSMQFQQMETENIPGEIQYFFVLFDTNPPNPQRR